MTLDDILAENGVGPNSLEKDEGCIGAPSYAANSVTLTRQNWEDLFYGVAILKELLDPDLTPERRAQIGRKFDERFARLESV